MNLKVIEETSTGLNTRFVNQDSGRSVSLEHAVQQIQKVTAIMQIMRLSIKQTVQRI